MARTIRWDVPVAARMRNLFSLKDEASLKGGGCGREEAVRLLGEYLGRDPSVLVRHEAAYVLGQARNPIALPVLERTLRDQTEHPMVRHEAAEAMGAIADRASLAVLREFVEDSSREVAETCQLAIQTIDERVSFHGEAGGECTHVYTSVDPAQGRDYGRTTEELGRRLLDQNRSLFERYEAMFALRNRGGSEAVQQLSRGLDRAVEPSALFRHEIAYVFGQMQAPESCDALERTLRDTGENEMVRHEAAEALGSISTDRCRALLDQFLVDPADVVRESCEVALDIVDYNTSDVFEYTQNIAVVDSEMK
mmetsp:Transcript_13466/g.27511  ORF Transcript_13466/g.27511 Transcript_13466/m.27511 type:complete len:309 (-) Transcript_13466:1188-2114(-)